MELKEIYEKLCTLSIPVAYLKFDKPQKLPFIAYLEAGTEIQGADNYNLYRRVTIRIELYSEKKNPELERKIENLFRSVEIEKDGDTYLQTENMFMTVFSFETIQKI
ncbi:MAG: hypothetical protein NC205_00860 [Prevotella sp.]|nr:hypothetical protein [Alistipes senegalensis]MCM1357113.1 hypothetical protein [Prevotella sp.]MCM1472565.1 hypothetical protein [Muribaculaceae bacterium]